MKKNNLKQLLVLTILTFSMGGINKAKAQSIFTDTIQHELGQKFYQNWEDLTEVRYTRHKDNSNWIISMYGIAGEKTKEQSPTLSMDFSKRYQGDALFGYTFTCHESNKKEVKDLFVNFKRELNHLKLSKKINFHEPELIPSLHIDVFVKLVDISNQLIHLCGFPQEL